MSRRLLVLSVYPEDQAGTRLRAHQLQPSWESAGFEVTYWSFLALADSVRWFSGAGALVRAAILARSIARVARLPGLLRRADVVLVLREVLPVATAVVERAAARRARLVWDVDDTLWVEYPRLFARWLPRRLRRTPEKYVEIARLSAEVWAGSESLADWCREHAASVVVVPTTVAVPERVPGRDERSRAAAWVGSASTAPFLEPVLTALADLADPPEVVCVGAPTALARARWVRAEPWSLASESRALTTARVGLYPIDREHPLAEGKAGLKAVLYMAHGLPCVVSPTAAVSHIIRDGEEGLHASTPQEWRDGVQRILDDAALWERLAAAGRERAATEFSPELWGRRLGQRLAALAVRTT
ncbi:MAG: glycosyltransferase family 4 protein [Pseudonocardia sp.]|nr:glycosyltransferase family 4 protein [Pseudonocardia sp.]